MTKILTSINSPLRIDSIVLPGNQGEIGMTFCPGKKDRSISGTIWNRELNIDMHMISAWGATAVVTLLEEFELKMLSVTALPSLLQSRGIEWHHLPIRDVDIPDLNFEGLWRISGKRLLAILSANGKVLLHCRGGIGRTGTIAAKLLVELGYEPVEAIALVRKTRPGTIETRAQEDYVLNLQSGQ